jgi:hypothetical protein
MTERNRTLDLLDRAYRAKAWHGPALLESLAGVTPAMAAKRVVKGAHTIWELVDHLGSWNAIVAERLAGKKPQVTAELNFPKTPQPTAATCGSPTPLTRPGPMPSAAAAATTTLMPEPRSSTFVLPQASRTWPTLSRANGVSCTYWSTTAA